MDLRKMSIGDLYLMLDRCCDSLQRKSANSDLLLSVIVEDNDQFCSQVRYLISEAESDLLF